MFKSAYGIFLKHLFIPEFFFGDFSEINNPFHFLNDDKCIDNLIYAGCTDFKLSHPEFWRHSIDNMNSEKQELLKKVLTKHNIEYRESELETWLWDFRHKSIDEELKNDLIKTLYPDSLKINNPFIKNLGNLYFSRAAIPFIQRKCAFQFLDYAGFGHGFGMLGIESYRYAHIPISIKIGNRCNVKSKSKDLNCIELESNTLFLDCKIRIHIFPYGLITTYFIYSISAKNTIQKNEIVETINNLLSNDNAMFFLFHHKSFNSISRLFDFITENISDSIYKKKTINKQKVSSLFSFLTLNIEKEYRGKHILRDQDILEVLTQDSKHINYSPTFLRSYSSVLGKYKGDFVFSSSEKILMSLTTQWKNYRKRKTKVRYYWLFIHLFQFVTSAKYLSQTLLAMLQDDNYNKHTHKSQNIRRITEWIKFTGKQHLAINPIYRKFFYKISELQSLKRNLSELSNQISSKVKEFSISEIHFEDIDEFALAKNISNQDVSNQWMSYMRNMPENLVKEKICEILGDKPKNDWGGEINDHFTNICINGRRYTAGFIFKGPSKFQEMKPSHLGKNADQIYRLNSTPCDIMIIQHCHKIGEAVRATVQAFASLSSPNRKYCLMDGRDTYKILKAYNKI